MLHTLITTYPLGMEDLGALRNLVERAADGVEVLVGLYPHRGPQEELAVHPVDVIGLQRGAQEQVPREERGAANAAHVLRARRQLRHLVTGRGSTGDRNSWRLWKRTTRTTQGGGQNIEHQYHRSGEWRGGQNLEHGYHRRRLRKLN